MKHITLALFAIVAILAAWLWWQLIKAMECVP